MSLQFILDTPFDSYSSNKYVKKTSVESPTSNSLLPTRSNTPEYERNSNPDNLSDRDSVCDSIPPFKRNYSSTSSNSGEYEDRSGFEIYVKPKRKNFANPEERRLFVEDYKRKYKTELCKTFELKGRCKFGDKCCFAHGRHELKAKVLTHVKYKTKPCKQYHQSGYCPYGQRCQYLHKEAISPNVFCNPAEGRFKFNPQLYEIIHEVNRLCGTDCELSTVLDKMPKRNRLSVFDKFNSADSECENEDRTQTDIENLLN